MVDFKISLNQNTHKPHSLRCFTSTNRINFFLLFKWQFPHSCSWTFSSFDQLSLPLARTHSRLRYPPYWKLWRTFSTPIPYRQRRVKSLGALFLSEELERVRTFSFPVGFFFPPSCRHAGLPYFILSGTTRNMSRKNRMESPKFMILSSLPRNAKACPGWGVEPWEKLAAMDGRKAPGRDCFGR